MNISWQAAAVLVPVVSTMLFTVWKLAKFEERFVSGDECAVRHQEISESMEQSKVEAEKLKGVMGRFDERIQTLFKITERQEATVDKVEELIRRNGGG